MKPVLEMSYAVRLPFVDSVITEMQELGIERNAARLFIDGLPQSLQCVFGYVEKCKR